MMAWLRFLGTALMAFRLLLAAPAAAAHPMPESLVWLDTTPGGMRLTAQLPLNRLEFAFGEPLSERPAEVLARHGDRLTAYLLQHVGVRGAGASWQVLRPALRVVDLNGAAELEAVFELRAGTGADARAPELVYDVITHEVRTHRVQVFLRNDWQGGRVGEAPLLVGELSYGHNTLFVPLDRERAAGGFKSLFEGGMLHIAEGTDHLLFLLMLLLVAPLTAQARRWQALRTPRAALGHTALVISAFTAGHTVTLVLGSLGLLRVPAGPVEIAVALTIGVAGVHAWRPLFARAEAWMALGFGLVHGLAFSASLSGAGLTPWQHAQALLAFNLGIEAMQLLALCAVLPALLMIGAARPSWHAHVRRTLAAVATLMAGAWVAQRSGLADLGDAAWLGDGGAVPAVLACLLWLGALLCLATTPRASGRRGSLRV